MKFSFHDFAQYIYVALTRFMFATFAIIKFNFNLYNYTFSFSSLSVDFISLHTYVVFVHIRRRGALQQNKVLYLLI